LVVGAYLLPTPVGTNASRLPELFAAPTIVATAAVPLVAVIAAAASTILLLPPVSIEEVKDRGDPALSTKFYAPLVDQLVARGVEGPIEVVPTRRRGEVAAVAPAVPIARGWLRQVDIGRNPVFYEGNLDEDKYRQWLDDNAIPYVALSNGPYDWAANREAALVRRGGCRICSQCGGRNMGPLCRDEPAASHLLPGASHCSRSRLPYGVVAPAG